jgi:ATP-dependent RNA helicase DeaD
VPIYGGQPYERQLRALRRGVHVIVATPGRLLDHMRQKTVRLSSVSTLVLDEADVMLDMGFLEDVEQIMAQLQSDHVTALFSATMPDSIMQLTRRYMRDPEIIRLSRPREMTVPAINQVFYEVPFRRKFEALCRVLDAKRPDRALVFCATKRMVDEVVEKLQGQGYLAEGLHGDMSQAMREKVLRAFRAGQVEVLVATDVAARGLDIPEVSHVVNFDIPPDPEYYVHRIGRTGRIGRAGEAITFVNPRELRELKVIERTTGARIKREEVPTVADAREREAQMLEEQLLEVLSNGRWGQYRALVEELAGDYDPVDVAAAALSMVARGPRRARRTPASRRAA